MRITYYFLKHLNQFFRVFVQFETSTMELLDIEARDYICEYFRISIIRLIRIYSSFLYYIGPMETFSRHSR